MTAPRLLRLRSALRAAGLLAAALAAAGCLGDAERGNPLDPLSDNFRDVGGVAGFVVRASAPSEGVAGALVRLSPLAGGPELLARAGNGGRYSLPSVPTGRYLATAEAPGYASDTDTVDVALGTLGADHYFRLNALPRVVAQRVRTERINRFWPEPFVFNRLVVEAEVSDPDGAGDLAHVLLVVRGPAEPDEVLFLDTLRAVAGTAVPTFARTFSEDDLPFSLQNFLGQNLFVEVTDRAGATVRGTDAHAVRIVEASPELVSPVPSGSTPTTSPSPTFVWEPLALPYAYTWRVTIGRDVGGLEVPVATMNVIPSSQTQVTFAGMLPPNLYFWTVSAVDVHGNLARSLPAAFQVAP